MLPILACIGIRRIVQMYDKAKSFQENLKSIIFEALSFQNLCTGVLITLMSYLFLISNATGLSGFRKTDMKTLLMSYLIFVLLEFVVYYLAIYSQQKKNPLYWVSFATLLIVPTISVGAHIDFVMRASIPALIVLFVLIMDTFGKHQTAGNRKGTVLLTALLLLGSLTAYHEIMRSVTTTVEHAKNSEVAIIATEIDLLEDGARRNFFGEYQDSIFFKYLAK
ncbi:MAG: hypothetical protein K2I93_09095 [Oscillospiraceae bacterium]|nr:hypothetical protein [Oscillospiraceae bacterium]